MPLDFHGPFAPAQEKSGFRRVLDEKLGSSLGEIGSSSVAYATRGGVGVDRPAPLTPIARLAENGRDYITESPARAKARATMMMGKGVSDGAAGYECRSKWARDMQSRALMELVDNVGEVLALRTDCPYDDR